MIPSLWVAFGGAIGAVARVAVGRVVETGRYPGGTLVVNVIGSFLLGVVTAGTANQTTGLLVGTGACGAFTTFSSFAYETVRHAETGDVAIAAIHATANLVGSVAALLLGVALIG